MTEPTQTTDFVPEIAFRTRYGLVSVYLKEAMEQGLFIGGWIKPEPDYLAITRDVVEGIITYD